MLAALLALLLAGLPLAGAGRMPGALEDEAPRAGDCLQYESEAVTLQGRLQMSVFPGPPHYRSFETGDNPESIWLLHLAAPVCIAAIEGELGSIAQARVELVQVTGRTTLPISLNGKWVRIEGTLFQPHNGHAHAPVMLRATRAVPTGSPP